MTVLVTLMLPVLLLVAGLVIDGANLSSARARASMIAAQAARAGADAGARSELAGVAGRAEANRAADQIAGAHGVTHQVHVDDGGVRVDVQIPVRTTFMSLIGLDSLTGRATATAELHQVRR